MAKGGLHDHCAGLSLCVMCSCVFVCRDTTGKELLFSVWRDTKRLWCLSLRDWRWTRAMLRYWQLSLMLRLCRQLEVNSLRVRLAYVQGASVTGKYC